MKLVRGFGKFLFEFFIGDTPELFFLGVAVLAIGSGLLHFLNARALVIVLLPLLVLGGLLASVLLERRRKSR